MEQRNRFGPHGCPTLDNQGRFVHVMRPEGAAREPWHASEPPPTLAPPPTSMTHPVEVAHRRKRWSTRRVYDMKVQQTWTLALVFFRSPFDPMPTMHGPQLGGVAWRVLLVLTSLLAVAMARAQCDCVLNMSFERAAGSCFGETDGPTCVPDNLGPGEIWSSCPSWGCGSTDIGPNPGGSLSMGNTQPTHGNSFLSMECSGAGSLGEGISMTLCSGITLQAGQEYCFEIDLITRASFGNSPGTSGLRIYGSNSTCQMTEMLWSLQQAPGTWQTFNFCFTPTQDWNVISFRVFNPSSGFSALGLDNWRSTDGLFPPQVPGCLQVEAEGGQICPGDCTTVSAIASDGVEPYQYTWTGGLPDGPGPHLVCPGQTTTYTVTVTDALGDTASADALVMVDSEGCIDVTAPGGSICSGDCFQLLAIADGGFEPYTYTWSNGLPAGPGPIEVCPEATTTYTLTVTDASGTTVTVPVTVEVNDENCLSVTADGGVICAGGCAQLTAAAQGGSPPYLFQWSPGNFTGPGPHTVCPGNTTIYTVTVTDQDGNSGTAVAVVQVLVEQVDAGPDSPISCSNDPIDLQGSTSINGGVITWSTSNGVILFGGGTLQPTVGLPGQYVLSVTDPLTGCTYSDAATIFYDGIAITDGSGVVFPNVITPNGDGFNDGFLPFLNDSLGIDLAQLTTVYELHVYNRWGQLIYRTEQPAQRWTGRTQAGEKVPAGVYFYHARIGLLCSDGAIREHKGHIQVLY